MTLIRRIRMTAATEYERRAYRVSGVIGWLMLGLLLLLGVACAVMGVVL